jgi:hypothetical protein
MLIQTLSYKEIEKWDPTGMRLLSMIPISFGRMGSSITISGIISFSLIFALRIMKKLLPGFRTGGHWGVLKK